MSVTSNAAVFNPANFVPGQEINNPWLPYFPGTSFIYHDLDNTGKLSEIDKITVTDKTKMVDGVSATVVQDNLTDVSTGQLVESTKDYFAQDKHGNVWYLGEASEQLANGHVIGHEGSWLGGVNGATPGIVMLAVPHLGASYMQENAPGVAADRAQVLSQDGQASVPYGSFSHLLVTLETSTLEPGQAETKDYAAGIGQVFGADLVTGERDVLVSVTGLNSTQMHLLGVEASHITPGLFG